MTEPVILSETDDLGRATITLNRPERRNAFDDALIAALAAELKRLEGDEAVRVVTLAAAGKSFCAGGDLEWMRRLAGASAAENLADARALAQLLRTLATLRQPTIALVQGAAVGGGVGLAACCDLVLAAEEATFTLAEVRLGIVPAVISPYLTAAVGVRAARRYVLTAEPFDAAEARRLGLVHEVVPAAELAGRSDDLSRRLLRHGPRALAGAKALLAEVAGRPIDDDLVAQTAERLAEVRASDEGREGIAAFLEKRPPGWVRE